MIERYNCYGWDIRRGEMRPEQDGQWVRHSDYAALEAKLAEANKDTALAVLNERTKAAVRDIERDSEVAGLKIALEQAWQSNRDRADIIAALEATPPAPKVTELDWKNGEARSPSGDLYEVENLGGSVWVVRQNGTSLHGWHSSREDACARAQAISDRKTLTAAQKIEKL